MGKKINPRIFRITTTGKHNSCWFADKKVFQQQLREDVQIRKYIQQKVKDGGLSLIQIDRSTGQIVINLHTSKPGVIIGKGGVGIEEMKKEIKKRFFGNQKMVININIHEIDKPDLDAELVLQQVIIQLEKRVPFRRAMKRCIEQVRRAGAKGVKIMVAGRLNGAEIARTEVLVDGKMPLSNLRADIDYARGAAHTIYGLIGVKVWVYKGEVFDRDKDKNKNTEKKIVKKNNPPRQTKKK